MNLNVTSNNLPARIPHRYSCRSQKNSMVTSFSCPIQKSTLFWLLSKYLYVRKISQKQRKNFGSCNLNLESLQEFSIKKGSTKISQKRSALKKNLTQKLYFKFYRFLKNQYLKQSKEFARPLRLTPTPPLTSRSRSLKFHFGGQRQPWGEPKEYRYPACAIRTRGSENLKTSASASAQWSFFKASNPNFNYLDWKLRTRGRRFSNPNRNQSRIFYGLNSEHSMQTLIYALEFARFFLKKENKPLGKILFVSKKRGTNSMVKRSAQLLGQNWLTGKWNPGILTNFVRFRRQVSKLPKFIQYEMKKKI